MSDLEAAGPNAEQIEFWNGKAGQEWAEKNNQMDRMLRPFRDAVVAAANPAAGESVLDIGCGCADTSMALAEQVGAAGNVIGVDISAPMLDLARVKTKDAGLEGTLSFELADASEHTFQLGTYDVLFSRFGVMFFSDPPTAFSNMRKAVKSGGRLAFICWAPVPDNEWVMIPLAAALEHFPAPEPPAPHAPGPFGLSDPDYTRQMLEKAGFQNVNLERFETTMRIAEALEKDQAADFFLDMGPVSRMLSDATEEQKDTARMAIQGAIEPHYREGAVNLKGSCWIVTADNP